MYFVLFLQEFKLCARFQLAKFEWHAREITREAARALQCAVSHVVCVCERERERERESESAHTHTHAVRFWVSDLAHTFVEPRMRCGHPLIVEAFHEVNRDCLCVKVTSTASTCR